MSRKKPLPITNGDEPVKTDLPLEDDFDDGEQAGDESVSGLEPLSFRLDDEVIGQRLDKVLSGLMPEFSRSRIQQWIEDGHVTVDGAPAKGKMTMLGDELVEVAPQSVPADQPYAPEAMALDTCTRTSPSSSSTSLPVWWCIRRPATGAARCSTACCIIARAWPTCRAPVSCTGWTRKPAA